MYDNDGGRATRVLNFETEWDTSNQCWDLQHGRNLDGAQEGKPGRVIHAVRLEWAVN